MMRARRLVFLRIIALTISTLCFLVVPAEVSAQKRKPAATQSVVEIDARLNQLQTQINGLNGQIQQLRVDSIQAVQSAEGSRGEIAAQLAQKESEAQSLQNLITSLSAQRQKARQDSLTQNARILEKYVALSAERSSAEKRITAIAAEKNNLIKKKAAVTTLIGGSTEGTASLLTTGIARQDSLLRIRRSEAAVLIQKHDKLAADSLQQEQQYASMLKRQSLDVRRQDSLLAANKGLQGFANQRITAARADSVAKIRIEDQKILISKQQQNLVETRLAKLQTELIEITTERSRIGQSFGSEQKKADAARLSYASPAKQAEAAYIAKASEKEGLDLLVQKIRIDSTIAKIRDNMDKAIQDDAKGIGGSKKRLAAYETELSEKLSKQHDFSSNPKVSQLEAQLSTFTRTQKKAYAENALAGMSSALAALAAAQQKTKAALDAYDQSHPAVVSAQQQQIKQLDATMGAKERELVALSTSRDSVEQVIAQQQVKRDNVAVAQNSGIVRLVSDLNAINQDYNQLAAQKTPLGKGNPALEATLGQTLSDMSTVNAQIRALQQEIQALSAAREKNNQALLAAQTKNAQTKQVGLNEKQRLDSAIAALELESTTRLQQNEQNNAAMIQVVAERDKSAARVSEGLRQHDAQIAEQQSALATVVRSRDEIGRQNTAAQRSGSGQVAVVINKLLTLRNQMSALQAEYAEVQQSRLRVIDGLKASIASQENQIAAAKQKTLQITAARDRARQDSITGIAQGVQAQNATMVKTKEMDAAIAVANQDMVANNKLIENARADSVAVVTQSGGSEAIAQKAALIETEITQKQTELSNLQQQRLQLQQEMVTARAKQSQALQRVQINIQKITNQQALKVATIDRLTTNRTTMQQSMAQGSASVAQNAATRAIEQQNNQLNQQNQYIAALQARRDSLATQIAIAEGAPAPVFKTPQAAALPKAAPQPTRSAVPPTVAPIAKASSAVAYTPAPVAAVPAAPSGAKVTMVRDPASAQVYTEQIYMLVGENKSKLAYIEFIKQKANLAKFLNADAYAALKMTIDELMKQ